MAREIDVCGVEDVPAGTGRTFLVSGVAVALWHVGGAFYATAARCPHADAPLCEGQLDGHEVTCPMHGWRFEVTSGAGLEPPHERLATYAVRRVGSRLLVRMD